MYRFRQGSVQFPRSAPVERGCGGFEWAVLDWNEPAIEFYNRLGAVPLDDLTAFRLTGESLKRLANEQRYSCFAPFSATEARNEELEEFRHGTARPCKQELQRGAEHLSLQNFVRVAGYDTHAAFSKAFKQQFDLSPSEFRQLGCWAATQLLRKG